jgi:hypothetical protein
MSQWDSKQCTEGLHIHGQYPFERTIWQSGTFRAIGLMLVHSEANGQPLPGMLMGFVDLVVGLGVVAPAADHLD